MSEGGIRNRDTRTGVLYGMEVYCSGEGSSMLAGSVSSEGGGASELAWEGCMDMRGVVFELARAGVVAVTCLVIGFEVYRAVMMRINEVRREIALEWLGSVVAEMWDFVAGWMAGRYT
jgi:hypothetical protein